MVSFLFGISSLAGVVRLELRLTIKFQASGCIVKLNW